MISTCSTCKRRKVRCDGQKPVCGSCAGRNQSSSPCDYDTNRSSQAPSNSLARGDACLPCRKKKKKCNGERPVCRTCVIAKKTDRCIYNTDSIPQLINTLVERNRELEKLLGSPHWSAPPTPPDSTSMAMSLEIELDQMSNIDSMWSTATSIEAIASSMYAPREASVLDNPPAAIGVIIVCGDWRIPDELSDPSSAIAAFTPSNQTSTDLQFNFQEMPHDDFRELRQIFIQHGIVLGQSYTRDKWRALREGDASCSVIHPAVVHVAQLFGARIANRHRIEMALVDEEQHLNNALMLLTILPMSVPEAVAHIQCYSLLAVHYMKRRDITTGRDWLLKADNLVRQFNLHINPPADGVNRNARHEGLDDGHPYKDLISFDEEDEMRDALCQLLYIDSVSAFRMQLPPLVCPRIRREFEGLMHYYNTRMQEASLVIIRMTSVILLQDAHTAMITGELLHSTPNLPPSSSFPPTIRHIYLYLADVNELTVAASVFERGSPKYLILKQCTLVAVTALASVYHLSISTLPESHRKCLDSIAELVSISDSLSPEDCSQLDPIISACWSIALRILLQIQLGSEEHLKHGVHVAQVPTFIKTLHDCAGKVKWSFPLAGGTPLNK
ncbi:hypothetical protein CPB83DRAFT_909072 [Crepidotus variabilis]|uniref:Zn(2)-C6 fungal-type domain-containing protein n=1 Tax=Crepidotus variabilis TaxID=179855 RepID=A0A9P6JLY0_9AGAR|nr:hypothetical protein CPB83DRAFT_909072 [Crepidotus variabilis]